MPHEATAPDGIMLRPATPADCQGIVTLVRLLAAHIGDETLAKVTPEVLTAAGAGPHPLWRGIVAEAAGKGIVGVCIYSVVFSTWIGAPGIYVIDLYVKKDERKTQLGRRLLAFAARQARAAGARFIRLDVDVRNAQAEGFYHRLGFQKLAGDASFVLKNASFDALADGSGAR